MCIRDSGYTYEEGVLTFTKAGEYTVRNKNQSVPTAHRIVMKADASVTLAGVFIRTEKEPAVDIGKQMGSVLMLQKGTASVLECEQGTALSGMQDSSSTLSIACSQIMQSRDTTHICDCLLYTSRCV